MRDCDYQKENIERFTRKGMDVKYTIYGIVIGMRKSLWRQIDTREHARKREKWNMRRT